MIARIAGTGCVTPMGTSMDEVWRRVDEGEQPALSLIKNPETGRGHTAMTVPQDVLASLATLNREPRLRRASPISLFAAAAGKAALAAAGGHADGRLALVFGVSSGGVIYTRRFYEQVVKQGANSASPMLFPETVYNAPASHLAALLGMDGATYTLVGDATAGLQALQFATDLLAMDQADRVLVVAAEELDWILAEAHHEWRILANERAVPHSRTGATIAEGAAAVLLTRDAAGPAIEISGHFSFFHRREAARALTSALARFRDRGKPELLVDGADGTWLDDAIRTALDATLPAAANRTLRPKEWFGESIGCAALLQIIAAADALDRFGVESALVPAIGWNQQAAAAWLTRA